MNPTQVSPVNPFNLLVMGGESVGVPVPTTVAVLSYTNAGNSPHDNNVMWEYRRSRGTGAENDTVLRILITNSAVSGGTQGVTWHEKFPYTDQGYADLGQYLRANHVKVLMVPYAGQDDPYFVEVFSGYRESGTQVVAASGQSGRNFSLSNKPTASPVIFLAPQRADADFGNGLELKLRPPDQGVFTNANTLSQTIASYSGLMVRMADVAARGDYDIARLGIRTLATPNDSEAYDIYDGYGFLAYTAGMPLPAYNTILRGAALQPKLTNLGSDGLGEPINYELSWATLKVPDRDNRYAISLNGLELGIAEDAFMLQALNEDDVIRMQLFAADLEIQNFEFSVLF
jgi:hypothetical protein